MAQHGIAERTIRRVRAASTLRAVGIAVILALGGCTASDVIEPSPSASSLAPDSGETENPLMSTSAQATFDLEQTGALQASTAIEVDQTRFPVEWARAFVLAAEAWINAGGCIGDLQDSSAESFADAIAAKYDESFSAALFAPGADASWFERLHRQTAENARRAWEVDHESAYGAALTLYDYELVDSKDGEFVILLTIALRDNLGTTGAGRGGSGRDQVIVTDHRATVIRESSRWAVTEFAPADPF